MTASSEQPTQRGSCPPPPPGRDDTDVPEQDGFDATDAANAALGELLREAYADIKPDERSKLIRTANTQITRHNKPDA